MPNLFRTGKFHLHSGGVSPFKIDCDALTREDWETLALLAVERLPAFGEVEGVPRGGLIFAQCLKQHAAQGPLLIADDVFSTGASMEAQRAGRDALGIVVFNRSVDRVPFWINYIFEMTEENYRQENSVADHKRRRR